MKSGVLLLTLGAAVASAVVAAALVGPVGPSGAKASSHNVVGDGVDPNADNPFLASFPYVAAPKQGYDHTGHE
jgi:opacity protein-like surface antigen